MILKCVYPLFPEFLPHSFSVAGMCRELSFLFRLLFHSIPPCLGASFHYLYSLSKFQEPSLKPVLNRNLLRLFFHTTDGEFFHLILLYPMEVGLASIFRFPCRVIHGIMCRESKPLHMSHHMDSRIHQTSPLKLKEISLDSLRSVLKFGMSRGQSFC